MTGPIADRVPVGPLAEWLTERAEAYGGYIRLARLVGMDESRLRRLAQGNPDTVDSKVSIWTVDRILVAEGSASLEELYPASRYPVGVA
jgi:hypothetical protein